MGQRIRRLREAKRLSQGDLAKHCGVTRGAVSQWESDTTKNIKLQIFLKLLDALKVDFQYLIFGDGAPEATPQDEPGPIQRRR
jgi:transcriptional regulator with XRE-family HTH domain